MRTFRNVWHILTHWEYWPMKVFHFPIACTYIYYMFRSGEFFWVSRINPSISMSGIIGEKKSDIMAQIPKEYLPQTYIYRKGITQPALMSALRQMQLSFPLILKPNIGLRGKRVHLIKDEHHLWQAIKADHTDQEWLIQEHLNEPFEAAVLYHRMPGETTGKITSLCYKGFLTVIGDGHSTIAELMLQSPRASIQLNRLLTQHPSWATTVLEEGCERILEPIGNHNRGTQFLDGNDDINTALTERFDELFNQLPGINYGRVDLKISSRAALLRGESFRIMEINGVSSEPAHIYQSGNSLWDAWRDYLWHIKLQYQISRAQKQYDVPHVPLLAGWKRIGPYLYPRIFGKPTL